MTSCDPGSTRARRVEERFGSAAPSSIRRKLPSSNPTTAAKERRPGPDPENDLAPGQRCSPERNLPTRVDDCGELRAILAPGPVTPPDAQPLDRPAVEPEDGDTADPLGPPCAAGDAENRVGMTALARKRTEPLERCGVEDTDELLQVLANRHCERNLEGRLLALAALEGRSVTLGEYRQRERNRQEGNGYDDCARTTGEAHSSKPRGKRAPGPIGDQPGERSEDARDEDRGDQRNESRKQQEQESWTLRSRQTRLVDATPEQRDQHDAEPRHTDELQNADARSVSRAKRDGDRDQHRGDDGDSCGDRQPSAGEDALLEDSHNRGAGQPGRRRTREAPGDPPDEHTGDRDDGALDDRQQPQLPRACAVPRQATPSIVEIATHPACGKDRERKQQRCRFAADEQQPVPGDGRCPLRLTQLLLRRVDGERRGSGRERRPRALDARTSASTSHRRGWPAATGHTHAYVL